MIIYQFQCRECGSISDQFFSMSECPVTIQCEQCNGVCNKIISIPASNLASESPDWIKSITEVVNKEGGKHCQQFLKDPTRDNYKAWKRAENVRHLEPGERKKPKQNNITPDELMKYRQKKRSLI